MSSDRIALCSVLLRALGDRSPVSTAAEFEQALAGWDLVDVGGAVVMIKGAEMHVGAAPEARGRWFTRRVVKLMAEVLRRHGKVETVAMKDHATGRAFALRLGFEQVGESGAMIRYELRNLRHAKPSRPT